MTQLTDEQIIEFATEFRDGILDGRPSAGMCAAICWPLVPLLNMSGIECDAVESRFKSFNHIWIRLPGGRALDPTCDQFNEWHETNRPAVYLGEPIPELHRIEPC